MIRVRFLCDEVVVRCGGNDPVDPGLFVLMAGRRECCSGELLSIEAIWRLLRGVLRYWQSSFDGFRSKGTS